MIEPRHTVLLRTKLEEAYKIRALHLAQGGCADYADYRESVGFIKGLAEAQNLIDEVNKEAGVT